jgi:hypothetical protein
VEAGRPLFAAAGFWAQDVESIPFQVIAVNKHPPFEADVDRVVIEAICSLIAVLYAEVSSAAVVPGHTGNSGMATLLVASVANCWIYVRISPKCSMIKAIALLLVGAMWWYTIESWIPWVLSPSLP